MILNFLQQINKIKKGKLVKTYKDEEFRNSIISAINQNNLIIFVGAGFSKLCGLPLWQELAERLINQCVEDKQIELDFKDRCIISKGKDAKFLITTAYYLHKKAGKEEGFFSCFKEYLKDFDKKCEDNKEILIDFIKQSNATVLTTNSDNILQECFEKNFIICKEKDFRKIKLDKNRKLIYLHGHISNSESLVFTTDKYLKRYTDECFRSKIQKIFDSSYTILFVGYGLNEMQLLDFVTKSSNKEKNKYVLEGFFSYEDANFEALRNYYSLYGLELIGYSKDEKNYEQLIDVLKELIFEMKEKSKLESKKYFFLYRKLNQKPNEKIYSEFKNGFIALENEAKKTIIEKISKVQYMDEWFLLLFKDKELNFFDFNGIFKNNKSKFDKEKLLVFELLLCSYRKNKCKEILDLLEKFVLKIIEAVKFIKNFKKYKYLVWVLVSSIFVSENLINNEFIFNFMIKNIISKNWFKDWESIFFRNEKAILKAKKEAIFSIFNLWTKHLSKKREYNEYYEDIGNELLEVWPSKMKEKIEKELSKIIEEPNFFFGEVGSLIFFIKSRHCFYDPYEGRMLKWYIFLLNKDEVKIKKKNFKKLIESKIGIKMKTSLYLLYYNFEDLKSDFLEFKSNPFEIINLYSDLCMIIEDKWDLLSEKEKEIIRKWIIDMKIEGFSSFYNEAYKLDLVSIIAKKSKEEDFLKLSALIKNNFSSQENDEYSQLFKPFLRSRKIHFKTSEILEDKKFKEKILKMEFDEFFENISKELAFEEELAVQSIYMDFFKSGNLKKWIIEKKYKNLEKVPSKFAFLVLNYVFEEKNEGFHFLKNVISKLIEKIDLPLANKIILKFLTHIYFNSTNFENNEKQEIYLFIESLYLKEIINNEIQNGKIIFEINWLMNNIFFLSLSILISYGATNKNQDIIVFLEKEIKNEKRSYLIKTIICSNIEYLWYLDKSWIKKNIKEIFNNNVKSKNFSVLGLSFSKYLNLDFADFIDCLYENKILDNLLKTSDFEHRRWNFTYGIFLHMSSFKNSDLIFESIIMNSLNFKGLYFYFKKISEDKITNDKEINVNFIFKKLIDKKIKIKDEVHFEIDILLIIYSKLKGKSKIWDFIEKAIPQYNVYDTYDISQGLSGWIENNDHLIKFVKIFVCNIKNHFYCLEEICKIINTPDWSGRENEKEILINKVGRKNQEFWNICKCS